MSSRVQRAPQQHTHLAHVPKLPPTPPALDKQGGQAAHEDPQEQGQRYPTRVDAMLWLLC